MALTFSDKHNKAFEIMKLQHLIEQIGVSHLTDEQVIVRLEALKQRKELLIKQLYQLMVADRDV